MPGAVVLTPCRPRHAPRLRTGQDIVHHHRRHVTHTARPGASRRSCRIMVLAASWALSDLGKQRLAFSGGRDVPVSESLHPRSGFVWDSGMAGPRLCQLLEVLGLPAFQVKVVYHPTNLATLRYDLLRLLYLLFRTP